MTIQYWKTQGGITAKEYLSDVATPNRDSWIWSACVAHGGMQPHIISRVVGSIFAVRSLNPSELVWTMSALHVTEADSSPTPPLHIATLSLQTAQNR